MKKYPVIIFLFVFNFLPGFGQSVSDLENRLNNSNGQDKVEILNELSAAYLNKDIQKSINYGEEGIKSAKKFNSPDKIKADLYNTLGKAYYFRNDYKESVKNYNEELEIIEKGTNYKKIAESYYNIAIIYEKLKKYRNSESSFENSLIYAKKINDLEMQAITYRALSALSEVEGKKDKAFQYLKEYLNVNDKIKDKKFKNTEEILLNELEQDKSTIKGLKTDTKNKEKQIDSLNLEKQIIEQLAEKDREIYENKERIHNIEASKQKYRISVMIIVIILLFAITAFVIRSIIQKRKANKILITKNKEIEQQKEEIETQNNILYEQKSEIEESHKNITQSITYAKRIQKALIRGEDILEENFSEHFILFKPKDIVSGDFYWVKKISNFIAIVAADCTGHGVPGAFMSMMGVSLLNQIVTSRRLDNPGEILNTLRNRVKKYLHQTGDYPETKDGMDMAFVLIDTESLEAKYAGANNSLYLVRNRNFSEYKPTRNPIGIHYKEVDFNTQAFKLEKGDSVYLFSDGYADQFGGPDYAKFKVKRFKNLLTGIADKGMPEQKEILENTLNEWKGNKEQIDDILLMGIKI